MARAHHAPGLARAEGSVTVLFCLADDAYATLNPRGRTYYEPLKRLSGSEALTLALPRQQLRGVESERSFLRDAERFLARLFPGAWSGSPPPRCTAACAGSGASWSRCGGPCWRSWSATRRR